MQLGGTNQVAQRETMGAEASIGRPWSFHAPFSGASVWSTSFSLSGSEQTQRKLKLVLQTKAIFAVLTALVTFATSSLALPPSGAVITNIASVTFVTFDGGTNSLDSTAVLAPVQDLPPPAIHYYTANTYSDIAIATGAGAPLYVQASAPQCNTNGLTADSLLITITSTLTGDTEMFLSTETAANSGLFRILPNVPTASALSSPPSSGNGVLETLPNDTLTASFSGCGSASTATTILVDPTGVVFDSSNNNPIAGASVTLIDVTGAGNGGNAGGPAQVFEFDGVTPAPSTVITGPDGQFHFPLVQPSTYRLQITPPAGYVYPSTVPVGSLPAGRTIDPSGSYGGNFSINPNPLPVQIDVPMDPASSAPLFIVKTASVGEAEIGDIVEYTVKIQNNGTAAATAVTVLDRLPAGFAYLDGSARLDGVKIANPSGGKGPKLDFAIGNIAGGATVTLTYRVRVGVGALQGNGKNHAQAIAAGPPAQASNVAIAKVRIKPGVFDDKGIVIGKVFVDKNHNDIQDDGEPGIPGVRIYMEDGTYAITDSEGKYSLYGLRPFGHVLKVDEITLPAGWKFSQLTARHSQRGTLCLVDIKKHELRKVNFADVSDDPKVLEEVERRRAQGVVEVAEIENAFRAELTADGAPTALSDIKAQPAAGIVGGTTTNASPLAFQSVLPDNTLNSGNSTLPSAPVATVPSVDLEKLVADMNNECGFVDLRDNVTLPIAQANVRVKGRAGSKLLLSVNDRLIPETDVGKRVKLASKDFEAWEYVGVGLRPGPNTLEVTQKDGFGNVRGSQKITVIAPGRLGEIQILLPKQDQIADGVTPATIQVLLLDDKGVPVTARTPLTLEASLGRWQTPDFNPTEPGVQVFLEGGKGEFVLLPPGEPGDALIVVSSGVLEAEATLPFLPNLRPIIAAGVIETRVQFNTLDISALRPSRKDDGFEEELRNWAFSADSGHVTGGGRAALFLKGKVKGDYLLTLAYDSEKNSDDTLFRDIEPDRFYPVYGDSSVRGFDAQSTSRLYVRVDKKKCYLLYGDFSTQSTTEARGLGNYNRSMTGVKEHYENSRVSANAWATYDTVNQVVKEIAADGTSGPYFFTGLDFIQNSEKVEILVRDRNQPAVILKTTPMQRFADYEFEPFSGRLLFKAPVPSLDENLNPISIRITFEVDQGGDKFWLAGADGQLKLTKNLEVGGSTVYDGNPNNEYQLHSANATYQLMKNTFLFGEVAQSHSDTNGTGSAGRIEVRRTTDWTDLRVYAAHVETNFDNTSSIIAAGRQEIGAKLTQKLTPQTRLVAEAINTRDLNTRGEQSGVMAALQHTFDNKVTVEVGGRHSHESDKPSSATTVGSSPNEMTSVRGKVTTPVPFVPQANVYGEWENDVEHTDRRLIAFGGDYQVLNKTRLYARHEFLDALGDAYELNGSQRNNRTVFGLQTEYMKDGQYFNEYRMRDSINGREAEAAIGLRNVWYLSEGLKVNTTFERVNPITGTNVNLEATAATAGFEYLRKEDSKLTGRVEVRTTDDNDHWLSTLGYAHKLDDCWTALSRSILDYNNLKTGGQGDVFRSRTQFGVAYRPVDSDVWNALARTEYKYEHDESDPTQPIERHVVIFTAQINYQPLTNLTLSLRYAPKIVFEDDKLDHGTYDAHLVAVRAMYDLTKRWSVGLNGSAMFSGNEGGLQYALGPEIGFRAHDHVWISVGYNFTGFHDDDLSGDNYTDHGVFIGMKVFFDENLFGRRKPEGGGR
jgi:uncharacterized repeat protein (TIGR01451 family)